MHCVPLVFTIAVSIVGFPSPAIASLCGVKNIAELDNFAEQLIGEWDAVFHPGYVMAGTMVMPHPAAPARDTGAIEIREGRVTLIPYAAEGIVVSFEWETDISWSFDAQPSVPELPDIELPDVVAISDEDIGLHANCDVNDLPRLVGASSTPIEGGDMTFVLRLMVLSNDLIYGFQQMHGMVDGLSVIERRTFRLSR